MLTKQCLKLHGIAGCFMDFRNPYNQALAVPLSLYRYYSSVFDFLKPIDVSKTVSIATSIRLLPVPNSIQHICLHERAV